MRTLVALLGTVLLCLSATPAYALRCGNRLVSPGISTTEVRQKCGEPVTVDWRVIYRPVTVSGPLSPHPGEPSYGVAYVPVVIEVWTYNFGPQRFMQEFSFEEGRLIDIRALGYGY